MKYVYIESYGCSANLNNGEIMKGLLSSAGYMIVKDEKIADVIVVNTCIVKGKTESKILRRIQDLAKGKLVVVSGCMPETNVSELRKVRADVLMLGTHHVKDIVKLLKDFEEGKLTDARQKEYLEFNEEVKLNLPKIPNNKIISVHQISEGCLGDCNYCKTKLAKGRLFSYPQSEIIKSIESDLMNGAKEIWITSQDNASFGLDRGEQELCELLRKILDLKHRFKLRLGMMNPNNVFPILDELIDIYGDKKMFKFLHIPIQSGSNNVLKNMCRNYNIQKVYDIIYKFKNNFPNITISTDIIVGYPTETEKDFEESLKFVEEIKPDVFNLSKFSKHKGTKAESLKELNKEIISKRTSKIMELHNKTALENKKKYVGEEMEVFVDEMREGIWWARDDNYNIVLINSKENLLGKKLNVKIKSVGVHYLIGEIV